jgi:hypothetical protein
MGSRIKSLFLGKSSNDNPHLRGQSYETTVALEPPVKGTYPVAGNGPNVLQEIQRSRAKRDERIQSMRSAAGSVAAAPNVPRRREDAIPVVPARPARPRTAPQNGTPGGGYHNATDSTSGRTQSGFSMKSPSSLFSNSRRNSIKSTIEPPPPVPTSTFKAVRDIQTYQPKKGSSSSVSNGFSPATPLFAQHSRNGSQASHKTHADLLDAHSDIKRSREAGFTPSTPPLAQHNRTDSRASHVSHVDLIDAHSTINRSREASQHRAIAIGARNYGEDVADRNIVNYGERSDRDHQLDLNSPEFSFLKSAYTPKKVLDREESHSLAVSALGHVLGNDGNDDDTASPRITHTKTHSLRVTTSAPRANVIYPPRTDSKSYATSRGRDADRSIASNGVQDRRGRAMSPLSSTAASKCEEPPMKDSRRQSVQSTRAVSTPPVVTRGQSRTTTRSSTKENTPPVAPPNRGTFPTQSIQSSSSATGTAPSKHRRRAMSTASQSNVVSPPPSSEGTKSRNGSVSYSAFPNTGHRESAAQSPESYNDTPRSQPSTSKRSGVVTEYAPQPPSLEGRVDLSNTVDMDVTKKALSGTLSHPQPLSPPSITLSRPMSSGARTISRPLSTISTVSKRSNYAPPTLSPLHVSPHDIEEPPSFPPENWPLPQLQTEKQPQFSLSDSIVKTAANLPLHP